MMAFLAAWPVGATATTLTTTHYQLDPDVANSFGGSGSSTHYGLVDSGGEAALGFGTSSSYRLGAGYVAQLEDSLQLAVLPSGVIAYYPLDTGVGVQAYDSSMSANTGVMQNSATWTTGQISGAVTLNGSTQYISTTNQLNNPTAFTAELWFKTSTSSGGLLVGFGSAQTGSSANLDRQVYMTNSGQLIFGTNPGTKQTATSASSYNNGAWHHLAATFGAAGMKLYVDGAQVATNANTTAQNMTGYWRFGYDNLAAWTSPPTSNYFAGTLDEAKIYNRQLSANEVLNEYNAGAAGIVSAQTIPQISAGASQTSLTDVIVRTDAPGYNLAVNQDHDLTHTDAVTTIPAIGPAIASPALWNEGTTTGLGFSLTAGTSLDPKWGSNPNYKYAAVPGAATTFHSRTGYTAGAPEVTTMQFRLDVSPAQKSGKYSNTVTLSATVIP